MTLKGMPMNSLWIYLLQLRTSLLTLAVCIALALLVVGCACPGRDLPAPALDKELLQDLDSSQGLDGGP